MVEVEVVGVVSLEEETGEVKITTGEVVIRIIITLIKTVPQQAAIPPTDLNDIIQTLGQPTRGQDTLTPLPTQSASPIGPLARERPSAGNLCNVHGKILLHLIEILASLTRIKE